MSLYHACACLGSRKSMVSRRRQITGRPGLIYAEVRARGVGVRPYGAVSANKVCGARVEQVVEVQVRERCHVAREGRAREVQAVGRPGDDVPGSEPEPHALANRADPPRCNELTRRIRRGIRREHALVIALVIAGVALVTFDTLCHIGGCGAVLVGDCDCRSIGGLRHGRRRGETVRAVGTVEISALGRSRQVLMCRVGQRSRGIRGIGRDLGRVLVCVDGVHEQREAVLVLLSTDYHGLHADGEHPRADIRVVAPRNHDLGLHGTLGFLHGGRVVDLERPGSSVGLTWSFMAGCTRLELSTSDVTVGQGGDNRE